MVRRCAHDAWGESMGAEAVLSFKMKLKKQLHEAIFFFANFLGNNINVNQF